MGISKMNIIQKVIYIVTKFIFWSISFVIFCIVKIIKFMIMLLIPAIFLSLILFFIYIGVKPDNAVALAAFLSVIMLVFFGQIFVDIGAAHGIKSWEK
jgi:hypothetical protein